MYKFTIMEQNPAGEKPVILITGALGFIGSCLAAELMRSGRYTLLLSDDLSSASCTKKAGNMHALGDASRIDRNTLFSYLRDHPAIQIAHVIHIGARTDTTEFNKHIFDMLNLEFSKKIWTFCAEKNIPLVYASSAATYGSGENGYIDDHALSHQLKPLNPYGDSKNDFDIWALSQKKSPPVWHGLKFFNVYGPNEYHKGRMASVIFHAFNQLRETEKVNLFRSHNTHFKDGEQLRDFIYVKDVVQVINWLITTQPYSGIYNLGTGNARTFHDLALATAVAMHTPLRIHWIDIPEDIREKYQYFTEAKMDKLRRAGYTQKFYSLEEGITDYVHRYLIEGKYY